MLFGSVTVTIVSEEEYNRLTGGGNWSSFNGNVINL